MGEILLKSRSPEETRAMGDVLGGLLGRGDVIAVSGELGAGKTCFAQGVASGLGVRDRVTSPTFTIIQEYDGRIPFYHIDLYRLEGAHDLEDLGYEDYIYGDGVVLIEWPDLIEGILPPARLEVMISVPDGEGDRDIRFVPAGARFEEVILEFERRVKETGGFVVACD